MSTSHDQETIGYQSSDTSDVNFVLTSESGQKASIFGDILPFYSSHKLLAQILVTSKESLARFILYSRVIFVCIISIISEAWNNTLYRFLIAISRFYQILAAIPLVVAELAASVGDSYRTLVNKETRSFWFLEVRVEARKFLRNLEKTIDRSVDFFKKFYLAGTVAGVLTLLLLSPAILSLRPTNVEDSFINRAVSKYRTDVQASGGVIFESSVLTSATDGLYSEQAVLGDRIIEHTTSPNETIEEISLLYGVSIETIAFNNNIQNDALPEKIYIPSTNGYIYRTAANTTPDELERIYKIDKNLIYAENEDLFLQEGGYFPEGTAILLPTNDFANIQALNVAEEARKENLEFANRQQRARSGSQSTKQTYAGAISNVRSAGLIWPTTGKVSRCVTGSHVACDIANGSLPPIFAAQSGVVKSVYRFSVAGYGLAVVIDHGNGIETLYAHMSEIYVTQGSQINQGTSIGRMGCTGYCTGSHLHFEVRNRGIKQNPLIYLP